MSRAETEMSQIKKWRAMYETKSSAEQGGAQGEGEGNG